MWTMFPILLPILFLWMVGDGFDFNRAYAQTRSLMAGNVPVEYDNSVLNITDINIKYDDVWGPKIIGLIQNNDPIRTIDGVYLSVQMYDKDNHLIGVMKGYPHSSYITPNQKTAFEIQSSDEDIRNIDHMFIEILATDWGNSNAYTNQNLSSSGNYTSNRPYMGIIGLSLSPELSEQIGLNQTKGFLLTNITQGSPAEKAGLRVGPTTKIINGMDIKVGGDIILKIDNREVTKIDDIMAHLGEKRVGDKVHLTFLRDNSTKELDVTLEEAPSQSESQSNSPEELYDQCVDVAGKSFCDFLFKR